MKTKDLKVALDAERRLVLRLLRHPEDFDKLPDKGILLPKSNKIVPVKSWKEADKFIRSKNSKEPKFMKELHKIRREMSKLSDEELLKKLAKTKPSR